MSARWPNPKAILRGMPTATAVSSTLALGASISTNRANATSRQVTQRVQIEGGELIYDNRDWEQRRADEDEYDARTDAARKVDEDKWDTHLFVLRFKSGWRGLFHTYDETLNAPPPKFVIENFLQEKSLTMLGGPPAAMKTYAALSIAKALITGEPLFDYFQVNEPAKRVLYLIPESSLSPFADA